MNPDTHGAINMINFKKNTFQYISTLHSTNNLSFKKIKSQKYNNL